MKSSVVGNKVKYLRVLSVDGGGVRGIIPSRILQEIESRTNKHISELFDIGAGTSTGGIIVLGSSVPDNQNKPKFWAKDIVNIYLNNSSKIFDKSFLRNLTTGFGLWGAKYDRSNLDQILSDTFDNVILSQALFPVYIPIYSILDSKSFVASSKAAMSNDDNDFYIKDIAGATSAAPTYFAPKVFKNLSGDKNYTTADGGLYANDPELIAGLSVFDACKEFNVDEAILVSIGTGEEASKAEKVDSDNGVIGWLKDKGLISDMMDAESDIDQTLASNMFKSNRYRLQVSLDDGMMAMDNSDPKNIQSLLQAAEKYISDNTKLIDEICEKLLRNTASINSKPILNES